MTSFVMQDQQNLAQQIIARSQNTSATFTVGIVSAIDSSGNCTVTIMGKNQTGLKFLMVPPNVGDNVLVMRQGQDSYVLGPFDNIAKPSIGTVVSAPSNSYTIVVSTVVGNISAAFIAAYTPTAGDSVLLVWVGSSPVVIGKQGVTGSPPAPTPTVPVTKPAPPPTTVTMGTTSFPALDSGTYRSTDGWRTDANGNVIQGTAPGYPGLNSGAWFYGNRIHASLAGATVTSCRIWLGRVNGGTYASQTANIQQITNNWRPAGAPTFTGSVTGIGLTVGQSGWFNLPISLGQALVNSGGSIGIQASSGSPYMRLDGLANTGSAGTISIGWKR